MYNKRPKFSQNKDKVTDKQQRNARLFSKRMPYLVASSFGRGSGNVGTCLCAILRASRWAGA